MSRFREKLRAEDPDRYKEKDEFREDGRMVCTTRGCPRAVKQGQSFCSKHTRHSDPDYSVPRHQVRPHKKTQKGRIKREIGEEWVAAEDSPYIFTKVTKEHAATLEERGVYIYPGNNVKLHQKVYVEAYDAVIGKGDTVHHRTGNCQDNRPKNLMLNVPGYARHVHPSGAPLDDLFEVSTEDFARTLEGLNRNRHLLTDERVEVLDTLRGYIDHLLEETTNE